MDLDVLKVSKITLPVIQIVGINNGPMGHTTGNESPKDL
jgi:hypothetical protein